MRSISAVFLLLLACGARADVKLHSLFSDHAVLQRDKPLPVWGAAAPGEEVTVQLGAQKGTAKADAAGRWMVKLAPQPVSKEALTLTATGQNTVTVHDILLGDVWLCSGQSNMSIGVGHFFAVPEVKNDIAEAKFPLIRHFGTVENFATSVESDVKGEWLLCSPQMAPRFSAVGFYFARKLHAETGVPIGILRAAKGSTTIEMWLAQETIFNTPSLEPFARKMRDSLAAWEAAKAEAKKAGLTPDSPEFPPHPFGEKVRRPRAVTLYNGMIAPLAPFALRGMVWYQGEGNSGDPATARQYGDSLRALITSWRRLFESESLPFLFVQLPAFRAVTDNPALIENYSLTRESQMKCLAIPGTGMATTIDIGEADDIHPKNKADVGERLALWALRDVYGQKKLVVSGPLYRALKIEGNKARLSFDHCGTGLMVGKKTGRTPAIEDKGAPLCRFAIAGADKKWVWADAVIEGDNVVVSSPAVMVPVAVRYSFSSNPEGANLYNREGLPAAPFRTDDW